MLRAALSASKWGLSSPCGDKLQCMNDFHYTVLTPLSSPCGDKLQYKYWELVAKYQVIVPLRG